ncbi:MAG: RIP metalloprotease RseP, partial [Phycisphaerae bacterium]
MSSLTVLLASGPEGLSLAGFGSLLGRVWPFVLILIGFSVVILFHELGHFLTAKWCGVRVDKLAIGFGKELAGFRRGETRYAINALPIGGYVKMLGQEDFSLDKSGQWQAASDPRSFTSQPVGRRMLIVSAGVAMNLIFAAVGFMIVFMIGMKSLPAKVGWVLPDSPAERYGLQSGDMIRRINGRWMDDFGDVMMAIALADRDETLTFQIERAGRLQSLRIPPEYSRERKLLQVGIGPALTRRVAYVGGRAGTGPSKAGLRVGDEIVAVDGEKVGDFLEMLLRMQARRGRPVQVLVNRPSDPDDPDSPKRMVACTARATMRFAPRRPGDDDTAHLLGLLPRCVVTVVKPRSPAAEAGMQPGDVIVRWADLDQPRPSEIRRSILQNEDQDLRVVVLRDGQRKELTIRPRRPLSWPFIKHPPQAGINFQGQDMDHAVVADTLAGWAVHDRLAIPRGARIVAVNEQRIGNWYDLVEALRAHAGQTVRLSWQHGDVQASGTLRVPNCLSALLGLPATAQILSIDGKNEVRVVE